MTRRTILLSGTSWIIGAALSTALAEPITQATIAVEGEDTPRDITTLLKVASPALDWANVDLRAVKQTGKAKSIPFGKTTTVKLESRDVSGVRVVAYAEQRDNEKLEWCDSLAVVDDTIAVNPKEIIKKECSGNKKRGAVLVQEDSANWVALVFEDDPPMNVASDFGFGLTLNNHWKDGKSFSNVSGVAGYFALSSLRNNWLRWIAHIAVLDDDPDQTFEVGLGTGALIRVKPKDVPDAHFAFAVGVGSNLMLRGHQHPWYTFIGLNYNLDRAAKSTANR